jgi:RNA ligase
MMNYLFDKFADTNGNINGMKLWGALQPHIEASDLVVNYGEGDREGLVLVTYSKTYQYDNNKQDWAPLVKHCRGIIFDATDNYKIVALPFSKFFNYGEGDIHYPSPGAKIKEVHTKVDGSLGILFYWNDKWHLTTRGSLNSDIGLVGQQIFDKMYNPSIHDLHENNTYLFEIIDPICRIVVQYGDGSDLVLLGCRNKLHGMSTFGKPALPSWGTIAGSYTFQTKEKIVEWLNNTKGTEFEGFVVHYDDGSIFKFKSEDYMRLHRILAHFTFKRVLEAYQEGEHENVRRSLPEELLPEFDKFIEQIDQKVGEYVNKVDHVVKNAPLDSRREFALYMQQYYKGSIALKYGFKYVDFGMNKEMLAKHILKSLKADDFEK